MAMKLSTVRGTPIHHVKGGGEGISPRTPAGMEGTVHKQYDSDRRGYQSDPRGGTPYHSERGNPGDARREVSRSTDSESSDHGNQNDPRTNGKGVVLDRANDYHRGFEPPDAPAMDSPVPRHASVFDTRTVREEDVAHMGVGRGQPEQANPDILAIGGVMSRGVDSTSHPDEGELELTADDTLKGPEAGTQKDVSDRMMKRERQ